MPDAPAGKICERSAQPSNASASPTTSSTPTRATPDITGNAPASREALAACRAGDALVVAKLDTLGRSVLLGYPTFRSSVSKLHMP